MFVAKAKTKGKFLFCFKHKMTMNISGKEISPTLEVKHFGITSIFVGSVRQHLVA